MDFGTVRMDMMKLIAMIHLLQAFLNVGTLQSFFLYKQFVTECQIVQIWMKKASVI